MFEKFNVPALYIANTGQLAVYASGRNSAITLDIGDGVAHIVQIYEGESKKSISGTNSACKVLR